MPNSGTARASWQIFSMQKIYKTVSAHPVSVDTNNIYIIWKKKHLHSDKLIRCVLPILNAVYRKYGGELLTPDQGPKIPVWCAAAPTDILRNGEYYGCVRVPGKSSPYAHNIALALDLWDWMQRIVTSAPFEENTTNE
ncbi:hypothetical protein OIDMADRAFT_177405 [Oidiodendron maius Zn]|uniref:Uncharacterized protein n=1 Tax=Oidiodendron maius (strain Zn) TaxID=913774 RepID=A0A0C3HA12_OIDMZ|nr:hypothetical protein OIDMADRAFT_177405 [Oidiodendron maius Zn]